MDLNFNFMTTLLVSTDTCRSSEAGPDSKIHGANMVPIWDRQVPGGPHVGPMNFNIWVSIADLFNIAVVAIYDVPNLNVKSSKSR